MVAAVQGIRNPFGAVTRGERATERRTIEGAKSLAVHYEGVLGMADELAGIERRELEALLPQWQGRDLLKGRREPGQLLSDEAMRGFIMTLDDIDDPALKQQLDNLLSPGERAVRDEMRIRIDRIGDLLEADGIIGPEDRKAGGYIPHIFDFTDEGRQLAGSRPLHTPRPRTKRGIITGWRKYRTLLEGIRAGHRPATFDPFKVYEQYVAEATRRRAMAQLVKDLRTYDPEGVHFLKAGEKLPEGFELVHHPAFEGQIPILDAAGEPRILTYRWAVRSNVANYIKSLAQPSALRQSSLGRGALKVTATLKRSTLGAALDVNFAGFEAKAVSYLVGSDARKVLASGLAAAVHSQEAHDIWLKEIVNFHGQKMRRIDVYQKLAEWGLTASSSRTEISRMLGAETPKTLSGLIPVIGNVPEALQTWNEAWQFDRAIPTWKREAALELIRRKMRKGMTLDAAGREAAADVNRAMGGLNMVALGRSKTMQDVAALLAIAPDWMESRLRLYGSALMPGAQNATSRRFMIRAMMFGAFATVMGSLLYAQERGWDEDRTWKYIADNLNPVVIRDGKLHINSNFMSYQGVETGQWVSPLTWEKDGWKILFGSVAAATGDFEAANLTLGNYLSSRLGFPLKIAKESGLIGAPWAMGNRDFRGLPIRTEKGWKGVLQFAQFEGTQLIPASYKEIGAATIPNFPGGNQSPVGAAINISGFGRARPISPFDTLDRAVQDDPTTGLKGAGYEHYRDLPPDLKGEFNKRYPDEVAASRKYRAERGQDQFDILRAERDAGLAELAPLADSDPRAYREQTGDLSRDQALAVQRELKRLEEEGVDLGKRKGDLGILDGYFKATEPATNPRTHVTDFDKFDALEATYRESLSSEQRVRLDEMLGYSADPTYKQLKADKKKLDDAGYFDKRKASFAVFAQEVRAENQTATPEYRVPETALADEDALIAWIKTDLARYGEGPEFFNTHWAYKWLNKIYENENWDYLESLGALEDVAIRWAYQQTVHSDEAYDAYKARTGLEPKWGQ